ncbi:MAG TPA: four-carbon acid sugar kinase family protein [Methylomirabilota bacterium]|nr:four-carbon acid sugar kinase family protein [Methylomirabilota bacterium]
MAATPLPVVTILADDLTGACDTGCLFAGAGTVAVAVDPIVTADDRRVIAIDTETRTLTDPAAAAALRAVAQRHHARFARGPVFKKIDSTMRGPVAAELAALLAHGPPFAGALVCPAFPALRRVVDHGRVLVDSVPVHDSPIGRDPAFRGASSDLAALLAGPAPVVTLGLDEVRAGFEKIAHVLEQHRGAIVAADALTDDDLASLARAALAVPGTLAAGSAGLGRALSGALGLTGPAVTLLVGRARLVVVGSLHPASRAQLDALGRTGVAVVTVDRLGHGDPAPAIAALERGRPAVVASETTPTSREAMARHLARTAAGILDHARADLVAVTGGDTAHALIQALRPLSFELLGAPADGLALGRLARDRTPVLPLLTKAGGFGPPDLFATLLGGSP